MGSIVNPGALTESGERCLRRLCELTILGLPPAQLITVIGTVVEGHVSRILARLIVLSDVESTPLGSAMLSKQLESMDNTWADRNYWLRNGFALEYTGDAAYQDFDVLVQARNAVVHGDGSPTDRQTRDLKKLAALRRDFQKRLDATLHGRLSFGPQSSDLAMQIAREFVVAFDAEVVAKHPAARRL
jgi:hypothetical protein